MPGEPVYVPTTRTIRLPSAASTNQGKLAALATTTAEWDQAVRFYTKTSSWSTLGSLRRGQRERYAVGRMQARREKLHGPRRID